MEDRIRFIPDGRAFFEELVAASSRSVDYFADVANVSVRTVRSWRAGETLPPATVILAWSKRFKVPLPKHRIIDVNERRKRAGAIGGAARQKLYGNLGTPEGRRKGGLHAQITHRKNLSSPFRARDVREPRRDQQFAELVGAALGDGMLTKYQFILYSNLADEREYADFLAKLVMRIFNTTPSIVHIPSCSLIKIISSRKNIVEHLKSAGLEIGNKTKRQASVPSWIASNPLYARACLRGLIDTDGCVYIDRHYIKDKVYESYGIAFTNASIPLLDFVECALRDLGYSPTRFGRHVRLRRRSEVLAYAKTVGFSNPKHSGKITV